MNLLRRIFSVCHSFEVALTYLLQADLQQLSVNYGDLYVGFLNGNPFQRSLRVQVLNLLMFTNETCCLLLAVWVWNFDQLIQFEMLCPLWLRTNESVDGNSIFKPRGGVVFANLSMVTESLNPDGGATLSMVTVFLIPMVGLYLQLCRWCQCFLNLDGGVLFIILLLNLSMLITFISPDGGVVFTTLFYGKNMKKKNMV